MFRCDERPSYNDDTHFGEYGPKEDRCICLGKTAPGWNQTLAILLLAMSNNHVTSDLMI